MKFSSKKRKAPQSETQTSSKDLHREEQKCEEKGNNHDFVDFPCIPIPMVTEILSRVRIKTLFNCRLVCKSWSALISTPEFAQLHLSRSPTRCLIKPLNKELQSERLHLIDPECPYSRSNKLVFIPKINLHCGPFELINSCNGLVCLCQRVSLDSVVACNIYVCNPVLKEYITLPKPPNVGEICIDSCIDSCAFGFSHITNQYKVVLSVYDGGSWRRNENPPYESPTYICNYRTQIYRLGEGSWRSIENAPYEIVYNNFNAFLNGAIHWIGFGYDCPDICCFDFVSEEFRSIPEPAEFDQLDSDCLDQMNVGVINDNLSVCEFGYYVGDRVNIWVMKKYGVKESWSKDFVITHMIYGTNWVTSEPIMVNGNGEILMLVNSDSIMIYDPKSEAFESEFKIFGVRSEFEFDFSQGCRKRRKSQGVGKQLKLNFWVEQESEGSMVVWGVRLVFGARPLFFFLLIC